MSVCPNINDPAWKALETAVGRFEAYKDFVEHDGDIRTVEEVKSKIDERDAMPSKEDIAYHEYVISNHGLGDEQLRYSNPSFTLNEAMNKNTRATEIVHKLAQSLSDQVGLDYQMISEADARRITANAKNPWNGEPAFYVGKKIYFVSEKLDPSLVLHEFSHPIVRSMLLDNPELGGTLYAQVESTPEGQEIIQNVKNLYPELKEDDFNFMEEVMTTALEKAANTKFEGLKEPTGFAKLIKNLLYSIKQFLRKKFGQKIDISKLDSTTTLDQLADMLIAGKNFKVDVQAIATEDTVAYARDQQSYIDGLMQLSHPELVAMTSRIYDIASKHIDVVQSNKNYSEMLDILADKFNRGDLQEMRNNLAKYKEKLDHHAAELKNDLEFTKNHVTALVNTLFRLQGMTAKIKDHMNDLAEDMDDKDNLAKAFYYDYLLKYWHEFSKELSDNLLETNLPATSPVVTLVNSVKTNLESSRKIVNKLYAHGARDTLYQQLVPMGDTLKKTFDEKVAFYKKRNAAQGLIDNVFKEYHGLTEERYNRMMELEKKGSYLAGTEKTEYENLKRESMRKGVAISKEKIEQLLKGNLGDANAFNSFFEGYLYNTDPVIGSFALYVKNNISDVLSTAHEKYNEFSKDMMPVLEAAGYNPTNVGGLGQSVGFIDTIGRFNKETGKFEQKEVWTLLNPFKGYRHKLDLDRHNIQEAQKQYALTGTEEDRKAMIDLISEHKKHLREYFHQQYKSEFYKREELLEKDDTGREAAYRKENIFERMRMLTEPAVSQMDEMAISDQLDQLWREYRQLYSKYQLNGELKVGMDKDVAERLREYRKASEDFYEWKERSGVFQNTLLQYEQELDDNGTKRGTDAFKVLRNAWIQKNTRIKVKPEFYEERSRIMDRIEQILSKLPDAERKKIFMRENWETILDLTAGFRDENGQPIGSELSEGSIAKVKQKQEAILEQTNHFAGLSGLTPGEMSRLSGYFEVKKSKGNLNQAERDDMASLLAKRDMLGLSKNTKMELFSLFDDLSGLQKKQATDYYTDIMNNWLGKLDLKTLLIETGEKSIVPDNADRLLQDHIINSLLGQSPEFDEWFYKNHIRKEVWDKVLEAKVPKWERLYVWNVIRPEEERFLESTDIKDEQGNVVETINAIPSTKYFARVVKDKWRNTKNSDASKGQVTTDNKGQWLPRLDVKGSPYINEEYFNLQKNNPAMFAVLQKLTEHHLKNQEGLGYKNRLYMDMPRFRKNELELLQTKKLKHVAKEAGTENFPLVSALMGRVRDFFRKAKDNPEAGYNADETMNLMRADMFDDEISSIPIAGLYDIDINDVSTDITHSMMRYMLSGERQKKLVQMNPMAQALKTLVNDPTNKVKDLDKINKFNFIHRGVVTYMNKKGKYVRKDAVNAMIEREFEGQTQAGVTKDMQWLNNTSTLLFKRAAFGFFALNIPSALKNSLSAKFQGQLEALAGKNMTTSSFAQAELWAFNTMGQVSFEVYKRGPKSLNIQVTELFDAIQDRTSNKFGEAMSRTFTSDVANMSWLYNFRKWTEDQATLQTFGGMMYHTKVNQNGTEIPYIEAFEVRDGQIGLKSGIDVRYAGLPTTYEVKAGDTVESVAKQLNMPVEDFAKEYKELPQEGKTVTIDNSLFKANKNRMHQVINSINGTYAKFDQPEMQRYLGWRFITFLRRYFTSMAVNRWGFQGGVGSARGRINPGLGDVHEGYYITTAKMFYRAVKHGPGYLSALRPEEKNAFMRMSVETFSLVALTMLLMPMMGWDPDDKDRYEKLRKRSGSLPFFGLTADDPEHPFNLGGWTANQGLQLAMQVRSENEQFLPWPNFGMDNYAGMLNLKSLAFGPTISAYQQMFSLGLKSVENDPGAYYKRAVGPYNWQQEGGSKFTTYLAKALGLTGGSLDPVMAIKNFQNANARAR